MHVIINPMRVNKTKYRGVIIKYNVEKIDFLLKQSRYPEPSILEMMLAHAPFHRGIIISCINILAASCSLLTGWTRAKTARVSL